MKAAEDAEVREARTFCATLGYTGCRISEAPALTADRINLKDGAIIIERAKNKGNLSVPACAGSAGVPRNAQHGSQHPRGTKTPGLGQDSPAMEVEPTKGWYVVRAVMKAAKTPVHTPRPSLRHGFGKAVTCSVPLNTLQRLFGHVQLSNTSIYADAMSREKRQIVERMWK